METQWSKGTAWKQGVTWKPCSKMAECADGVFLLYTGREYSLGTKQGNMVRTMALGQDLSGACYIEIPPVPEHMMTPLYTEFIKTEDEENGETDGKQGTP